MVIWRTRKTDKRKFMQKSNVRSNHSPQIMRTQRPRLPKTQREFIAKEIRRGIREGRPSKQAIAIAFSKARKKFGNAGLRITRTVTDNPNGRVDKRTRRLLFLLLGTAIALRILREAR